MNFRNFPLMWMGLMSDLIKACKWRLRYIRYLPDDKLTFVGNMFTINLIRSFILLSIYFSSRLSLAFPFLENFPLQSKVITIPLMYHPYDVDGDRRDFCTFSYFSNSGEILFSLELALSIEPFSIGIIAQRTVDERNWHERFMNSSMLWWFLTCESNN